MKNDIKTHVKLNFNHLYGILLSCLITVVEIIVSFLSASYFYYWSVICRLPKCNYERETYDLENNVQLMRVLIDFFYESDND